MRDIDAMVAERVMGYCVWPAGVSVGEKAVGSCGLVVNMGGWAACDCPCGKRRWFGADDDPHYSTNIADAWMVVEKMVARKAHADFMIWKGSEKWEARFYFVTGETVSESREEDKSAPLAICKAALAAVGVEVK